MKTGAPVSAELLIPANEGAPVIPWSEAVRTSPSRSPTGRPRSTRPQIRPVLAVWVDGALHSTTNPDTCKGRNLAGNPRCSLAVHGDGLDLVIEGTTAKLTDQARLTASQKRTG